MECVEITDDASEAVAVHIVLRSLTDPTHIKHIMPFKPVCIDGFEVDQIMIVSKKTPLFGAKSNAIIIDKSTRIDMPAHSV